MGKEVEEVEKILEAMAYKGLCLTFKKDQTRFYYGSRLMPGIFEYQFMPGRTAERDKKIARVIHAYKDAYNRNVDTSVSEFPPFRV